MINLTINEKGRANNIQRAREQNIIIPTIAQMKDPQTIPEKNLHCCGTSQISVGRRADKHLIIENSFAISDQSAAAYSFIQQRLIN